MYCPRISKPNGAEGVAEPRIVKLGSLTAPEDWIIEHMAEEGQDNGHRSLLQALDAQIGSKPGFFAKANSKERAAWNSEASVVCDPTPHTQSGLSSMTRRSSGKRHSHRSKN